jgi:hypothetical protein
MKSVIALMVLASFISVGCVGPFQLTRGLGEANAKVGNKWMVELVFLGLVFIHAYLITSLVDLLILNPIFFWKAPNTGPMLGDGKTAGIDVDKERRIVLTFSDRDGALRADLFERDRLIDTIRVTRSADGSMVAENESGRIRYESHVDEHGTQTVTDGRGAKLFSYAPLHPMGRFFGVQEEGPGDEARLASWAALP